MAVTIKTDQLHLTAEQIAIIESTGDIAINAVAGSGKTTTLLEYAAKRPADARILYLAFNKSVKQEATRKFAARGLYNVKVETAHSLAFRHIIPRNTYQVRSNGYKTQEIAELLGLKVQGEKHAEYIVANHVNRFITYFCNSNKEKVQELNYLDTIVDNKARTFVKAFYRIIENGTRQLLAKMERGQIEITHDFYLKKFQLSNPVLNYDYILFDEGQDASEAMLAIFLRQRATKLIVGDAHQQIYSWRYAVNSLDKAGFAKYDLSTSFRFDQSIADLAMRVLDWKAYLSGHQPTRITGLGSGKGKGTKATIARSNLGLLVKAIEFIKEHTEVKKIYFEGNINSYTYADDGTSLYDVLNLYNLKHYSIKDKLIRSMADMFELEDYAKKTEDAQLAMMIEIVNEYGNEIYELIRTLKELQTTDDEKAKAEMIFSTVHKSKGMEYDEVEVVNDFVTEEKLEKEKEKEKGKEKGKEKEKGKGNGKGEEEEKEKEDDKGKEKENEERQALKLGKLNEEINLLYVAITRTKNILRIPDVLLPKEFKPPKNIEIIKTKVDPEALPPEFTGTRFNYKLNAGKKYFRESSQLKAYTLEEKRKNHKSAYQPWTQELEEELKEMYHRETSIADLMQHFQRTKGAILARLKKTGCVGQDDLE